LVVIVVDCDVENIDLAVDLVIVVEMGVVVWRLWEKGSFEGLELCEQFLVLLADFLTHIGDALIVPILPPFAQVFVLKLFL
jgi:hypothetical protein